MRTSSNHILTSKARHTSKGTVRTCLTHLCTLAAAAYAQLVCCTSPPRHRDLCRCAPAHYLKMTASMLIAQVLQATEPRNCRCILYIRCSGMLHQTSSSLPCRHRLQLRYLLIVRHTASYIGWHEQIAVRLGRFQRISNVTACDGSRNSDSHFCYHCGPNYY